MKKFFSLLVVISCLFAVNWSAKALTYTVTVPDGTEACFIAGGMNGWTLDLSSNSRMTKVEGTNQFTIDFPDAKESDEYHYYAGPNWDYAELKADGTAFGNGENRTWTASDVVTKWSKELVYDERTVSIEVLVPSNVQELYITGDFDGWNPDFTDSGPNKMTFVSEDADGKVFRKDNISYIDVFDMQFKVVAGPSWDYQQSKTNAGVDSNSGNATYGSTENIAYFDIKDFDAIYDPEKIGDITINATVPAGTDRVWIFGSFNGWNTDDTDALEMTKQDDGTFTYTVKNAQTFQYRLYNGPDWAYQEAAEDDPTKWDYPQRIATFDPNETVINITVWGWKAEAPNAVPQVFTDKSNVYSVGGQIVVDRASSQVDIFAVTGQLVQSAKVSGSFTSKDLSTGLYIVRVDGVSQKVMVQ